MTQEPDTLENADPAEQEAAKSVLLQRRDLLKGIGALGAMASIGAAATDSDDGTLSGGTMALDKAYQVTGNLYVGPDSARSTVSPKAGRYYIASDTEKEYYGDGNQWTWKGINTPVLNAQRISITKDIAHRDNIIAVGKFVDGYRGARVFDPDELSDPLNDIMADFDVSAETNDDNGTGEIYLPTARPIDVYSTVTADSADGWDAARLVGPFGAADVNQKHIPIRSQITDGSPVIKWHQTSNETVIEEIAVQGNGSEGTGLVVGGEDMSKVETVGAIQTGGIGIEIAIGDARATGVHVRDTGAEGVLANVKKGDVQTMEIEAAGTQGLNTNTSQRASFRDIISQNSAYEGIRIDRNADTLYRGGRINENGGDGIRLGPTRNDQVEISHFRIDSNGGNSINIEAANRVEVHHCTLNNDNSGHINIGSGAHRVSIHQVNFQGASSKYVAASDATDIYIDVPTFNGEQGTNPGSSTYTLSFDTAFTHYPRIDLTADASVESYTNWTTDGNGNYTGVDVTFGTTPSNVSWEAIPRNVGV